MKQQNLISEPLRYYLNIFKERLSKPQFSNFSDLFQGPLLGHGQVSEIADLYRKWEELPLVVPNFRSKVEIAPDQLEKFPIIQGKEGIVMTDCTLPRNS